LNRKLNEESSAMQGTHDNDIDESTIADGDGLDPREAARLLEQTTRDASVSSISALRGSPR